VHLNHWSCLSTKICSDTFLRLTLGPHTNMLVEMKRSLDTLAFQALVLMENCINGILSTLAQTDIESIPREVLEDIFAGAELYNQVVEEQRVLHSANQFTFRLLQRMCYSGLPIVQSATIGVTHAATLQVKELLKVLAVHHGNRAAKELHHWATEQNHPESQSHLGNHSQPRAHLHSQRSVTPEWMWECLEHTYLPSRGLLHSHKSAHISNPNSTDRLGSPESACLEYTLAKCPEESQTRVEPATQCRHQSAQSALENTDITEPTPGQPLTGLMKPGGCPVARAEPDPYPTACRSAGVPLSFWQQDQFSLELLFQAMMSSSELLTPLVPHRPTPECWGSAFALAVKRTRNEVTGVCKQTDSVVSRGDRTGGIPALDKSSERGLQDHTEPGALLVPEARPR